MQVHDWPDRDQEMFVEVFPIKRKQLPSCVTPAINPAGRLKKKKRKSEGVVPDPSTNKVPRLDGENGEEKLAPEVAAAAVEAAEVKAAEDGAAAAGAAEAVAVGVEAAGDGLVPGAGDAEKVGEDAAGEGATDLPASVLV
mmetsp:Transcript_18753/g.47159  ORF Transcript_18753/g.47159 Transcript_18753/m.47159 type:complete len:140 (-) Transcript_18753:587-1006(-)